MSATGKEDDAPSPPHGPSYKPPSAPRPGNIRKPSSALTLEDLAEIHAKPAPRSSPGFDRALKVLSGVMSEHYAGMERGPGGPLGSPLSQEWGEREGRRREREDETDEDVPALSLSQQEARDSTESEDEKRTARYIERFNRIRPTNWSDRKHGPVFKAIWDAYMMERQGDRSWSQRMDESYDRVDKGMRVLFPELEKGTVRWSPNWVGEMITKQLREEGEKTSGRGGRGEVVGGVV